MTTKKSDNQFFGLLFLLVVFSIILYYVPAIRYIIGAIIGLIIIWIIYRYWKRKNKVRQGEYYTVEHHCPKCGRMNVFKYAQGHDYKVTVRCWYCHLEFTR